MKRPLNKNEKQFLKDALNHMADQIQPGKAYEQAHENNMVPIAARKSRTARRKRLKYLIAAALLLLALAACTIKPVRTFICEQFEKFTSITLTAEKTDTVFVGIDVTYIPEGFQLVESDPDDTAETEMDMLVYANNRGTVFTICYEGGVHKLNKNLDTEEVEATKELDINGWNCTLIWRNDREDVTVLMLMDKGCLELVGSLEETEITNILESITER